MRSFSRSFSIFLFLILLAGSLQFASAQVYTWKQVRGAPFNGSKQDGICFIHPDTGWVVNGSGKIYRTINGGTNWIQQRNSAGTYFRAVHFINGQVGFAGNVGLGYFPGVTDQSPLYRTNDGGNSWIDCSGDISGSTPAGICAIAAPTPQVIYAAGRVGGPAVILKSVDGGLNWDGSDLPAGCQMVLDLYFSSADTGFVFAGTNANIALANALILRTTDGGKTWAKVYQSTRAYEIIWKASFPSRNVGYANIQSYDANTTNRYIVKTTDGGLTWTEQLMATTGVRTFGIGFIDDSTGWVGGETGGFETLNGGKTWAPKTMSAYANKFTIVPDGQGGKAAYSVGLYVNKLTTTSTANEPLLLGPSKGIKISPNPAPRGGYVALSLENLKANIVKADLIESGSGKATPVFEGHFKGTHESPFELRLPTVAAGVYQLQFTDDAGKHYGQKITIQ